MQYDSDTLAARAEKEEAEARSAKSSSEGQKLPRRYKLYDRIKDNVSGPHYYRFDLRYPYCNPAAISSTEQAAVF